ncbi:MAG: MMPL family transporter [Flintibacter sp.]|uniref:efflux RND transporter permease subunit n=1 Tax=Flintibacter sp. TaxID=1918624 RepID=UPI0026720489|nr:MMPL family transporter [Flintibacter sp.]MCI6149536.1 MMPL family transporter [Flintibacter sp.]MDD7115317.1 MMPL family transporter [Flintibacter sp.]MDY5037693.1 MMPL family transporter [Lawsonibacter sp.]
MQEKRTESPMTKVARFIVDKRKAFYLVFIAAFVFCAASINKVQVNNDITSYLPAQTETRRGLTIMDEEFITLGSANVMVSNVTYQTALDLSHKLENIEGVSEVAFDGTEEHYKNSSALFTISFDGEETDPATVEAMNEVLAALEGYDVYSSTQIGRDESATLQQEMTVILAIAAVVIVVVLLFTSKSYMEVPVYLIVFAAAAVLNMGTNFIFGTISFITNSIAVVLQLALAIDYAIIFCHRYMEERDNGLDPREADIAALSKAIVEISSSSLTTISGLVALMLMQLRIGFDMGIVLSKGIVCSMLCMFLLMPGLLMLFSGPIDRTRHRNLVPKINFWGKAVVRLRYILPPIFLVVVVAGAVLSSHCDYVFDTNDTDFDNKPAWRIADEKVTDTFGKKNTIAVLVPRGDYNKEKYVLERVSQLPQVTQATGLANIEVEDGRMLTDEMNPRQFSELAGVDIELARLLYQAYGLSVEEYGAIFQDPDDYSVPLIDVFEFLLDQKDKGVVNLTGEQADKVDDLQERLDVGLEQLRGEHWSRLVFVADVPTEGDETYALLDEIRSIAQEYYGDDVILVGNSTNAFDLASSFSGDNIKISILTALFVMVILLFTFKSAGLPILLVLTIQGSIWINFSVPVLTGTNLFFLSYLVVSSIQMGATIDYAIVITNRYMELKTVMERKQAAVEALSQSFPTILTSGTIMAVAGFLIGGISTDATIGSVGQTLGRGTVTSIILVMTVLPQLLMLGDALIERTAITLNRDRKQRFNQGTMRLDGHIRGHVSGFVDGEFKGVLHGSVDALIESKYQELDTSEEEEHTP